MACPTASANGCFARRCGCEAQDAVIKNLEIIGEACNNVTKNDPAFAQAYPAMPWGFAYEMRNALAHGYFKVDLDIVWATVTADLPGMKALLVSLMP